MHGSLRLNHDGITVLTQSYNPYNFSSEGMQKAGGQHYKVCSNALQALRATLFRMAMGDAHSVN